ncbi:ribonucleoside reductase beta chain [Cellulophaga phage phi14:2]|uniref:ribonucleoside-diphosphate reductase n=1 Tax=Cellulophaga phage phi14:2 TaxID=1327990 RepID=S0A029_9CAUD|nr:ribonucleoside reductase beta chain [Cellulophaga phage phi14:2]AGO48939.1 ribonucleoside-diphosphate reductase, beta subunit [Cellulophaga phage phi14:2]
MSIRDERIAFKPFQYQWAYDYWFKQQNAHWLHTEINMNDDVKNWSEDLDEKEKNVIGNILKGFTQTECEVGDYWSSYIPKWFPVPEIKLMAQTFGAFETIHAIAYSYLNDTLGLDDFESFMEDQATMDKLAVLMEIDPDTNDIKEIARSLALFSAAAEGIQLFSSFAVLLSFKKKNILNGIGKQMEFSVRDESLHSEAGCKLFRTLCQENNGLIDEIRQDIYDGIDLALKNEFKYIDKIFELGDLETINKEQLKNFMYDRANRKLVELGLKEIYVVDKSLLSEMTWFYVAVSGEQQTDFFANRESGYSKANSDWNDEIDF